MARERRYYKVEEVQRVNIYKSNHPNICRQVTRERRYYKVEEVQRVIIYKSNHPNICKQLVRTVPCSNFGCDSLCPFSLTMTSDNAEGRLWVISFHMLTALAYKQTPSCGWFPKIIEGSLLQAVSALERVAKISTASSERMFAEETSLTSSPYSI